MRILLIEDENSVSEVIKLAMEKNNKIVDIAQTGEDGISYLDVYNYAIVILDLNLPDTNGYDILQKIRNHKKLSVKNIPVLILSGYAQLDNKLKGLSLGADDYLTKPFSTAELLMRIETIIRRCTTQSTSVIKIGELEVDINKHKAKVRDDEIHLTMKEYMILELLSLKKGQVLSKGYILSNLYSAIDDEPQEKIIDVFIHKLRKKIEEKTNGKNYIQTVWGCGYKLDNK
jgi:two-component system cell cycle response regulator CtrA